jgi:polyisoprenyl-phosphate glycosyltransferase
MGFLIAGMSFLLGIVYAIMKIAGVKFPLGNPTVVILILFMGGIQLICVGILGEYIARIYDEVKQRPKFIVQQLYGLDRRGAEACDQNRTSPSASACNNC